MIEDYINNEIRDVLNDMDYDDAGFSSYDIENKQVSMYTDNKGVKMYKVKFEMTIYQPTI